MSKWGRFSMAHFWEAKMRANGDVSQWPIFVNKNESLRNVPIYS